MTTCLCCNGSGACPVCMSYQTDDPKIDPDPDCERCDGTGECPDCEGTGEVEG